MTPKLASIGWPGQKLNNGNVAPEDFLSYYTGKRILVTGGLGFLGSRLIRFLVDVDCELTCLTRERRKIYRGSGGARVKEAVGDIRQPAIWTSLLEGVDIVFHFAAQTSLRAAEENPFVDFEVNVRPLLYLVETCRQKGYRPDLLFSGTVTEAGVPARLPVDETHPDHPLTVYDLHKWLAEQYLKIYTRRGILRGTILRLANVYGPGPEASSPDRGVLNQMIRRALEGKTLTVYGEGRKLRDYLYIEDAARAFLMAGACIERLQGRHFVIGSGEAHTIAEAFYRAADEAALLTGRRVEVKHVEPPASLPPIEARNFVADSRRFSHETGWFPTTPLREGIAKTLQTLR